MKSANIMSSRLHQKNEDDLAEQFVGFMQQFLEIFTELKGKDFYLTGESVSAPTDYTFLQHYDPNITSMRGCMFRVSITPLCQGITC